MIEIILLILYFVGGIITTIAFSYMQYKWWNDEPFFPSLAAGLLWPVILPVTLVVIVDILLVKLWKWLEC